MLENQKIEIARCISFPKTGRRKLIAAFFFENRADKIARCISFPKTGR
jgi:hypothetical protein